MAGIKVHGVPYSPATMRVLATLHEKGLEYQFVTVDMEANEHKKQPYLSLNPFGQVPALEYGDLKLFESRAISQYIADEYQKEGTQLICPDCRKTKAMTRVWMAVEAHQFDPVADKLSHELVVKPMLGMTTNLATVEQNELKLAKVLDVYEAHLSHSKYLAGDRFSLADLHHIPEFHYLMRTRVKKLFDERPKVSAWFADISARPAWIKVLEMQ